MSSTGVLRNQQDHLERSANRLETSVLKEFYELDCLIEDADIERLENRIQQHLRRLDQIQEELDEIAVKLKATGDYQPPQYAGYGLLTTRKNSDVMGKARAKAEAAAAAKEKRKAQQEAKEAERKAAKEARAALRKALLAADAAARAEDLARRRAEMEAARQFAKEAPQKEKNPGARSPRINPDELWNSLEIFAETNGGTFTKDGVMEAMGITYQQVTKIFIKWEDGGRILGRRLGSSRSAKVYRITVEKDSQLV